MISAILRTGRFALGARCLRAPSAHRARMPEAGGNFTANALSSIARPPLVLS
jgi:hypothetical protein